MFTPEKFEGQPDGTRKVIGIIIADVAGFKNIVMDLIVYLESKNKK